jgi:ATP diphosphatase
MGVPSLPDNGRYSLQDLLRVMQRLRDPVNGCPWDLRQDFSSIVPSTLEEAYELASAIEHEDYPHVAEELGDVLFQVVFYARMGEEAGLFDFDGIVHVLVDKLVRRHPHVFANGEIEGIVARGVTMDEVKESWEAIKHEERLARDQVSVLADIPLALPALTRALKLQKRAANAGFDWPGVEGVLQKCREEIEEFEQSLAESDQRREEEIGDLLFSCVNLARHVGVDAEAALRRASARFESRVMGVEEKAQAVGKRVNELGPEQLDALWEAVKRDA